MGPEIGYVGFRSLGFGFHGFEDQSIVCNSVSLNVVHQ